MLRFTAHRSRLRREVLLGKLIFTHISSFGTRKSQCFRFKSMSPRLSRVNIDLKTIENSWFFKHSDAKNVGKDELGKQDLRHLSA